MKRTPEKGDVVLYHRKDWSLMTWAIQFFTRSRWNHAAILTDETMAAWYVTEATAEGVKRSNLLSTQDEYLIVPVPYERYDDVLDALAWAKAREGTRYGYWNAFMCGLNNVLAGLGIAIKTTDAVICSELVAECLEHAGFHLPKDTAQVSPGDLAEFLGVPR